MNSDAEIERLIATLALRPHPEGGFFAETYRSARSFGDRASRPRFTFSLRPQVRRACIASQATRCGISTPATRLRCCSSIRGGGSRVFAIGSRIEAGERPQILVPAGVWQGVRVVPGGSYALVGATVTPGFDFDDFEMGDRAALQERYPACAALLAALS